LAAILFVLLMGFASFRKGLLWALRGDMGDCYIVDQRRNWIVTKHVDPEELGRELGGAEGVGGSAMIELSKQEQQLVGVARCPLDRITTRACDGSTVPLSMHRIGILIWISAPRGRVLIWC
jgi:hypothetical protein